MAMVYNAQGNHAQALELDEKSLAITLKTLGEAHPAVGDTRYNMAIVYKHQGNLAQARTYYDGAYQVYQKAYGEDHSETIDAKEERDACDK